MLMWVQSEEGTTASAEIALICGLKFRVGFQDRLYSKSSGYDGPDLRCFEVTNALHKNINDNTVL